MYKKPLFLPINPNFLLNRGEKKGLVPTRFLWFCQSTFWWGGALFRRVIAGGKWLVRAAMCCFFSTLWWGVWVGVRWL